MTPVTHGAIRRVYLDHNATTPPDSEVMARLVSWAQDWGNPSSIHQAGRGPKTRLREARDQVAKMIGASALEVIFTAGGSESNTLAIKGALAAMREAGDTRRHILTSELEHPSVRRTMESLGPEYEIEFLSLDRSGRIDVEDLRRRLRVGETALVSTMLVNNETGVIQPVAEIAALAKEAGARVHTDAVQGLGRLPIDVHALGVDYASFAGHKFYALRGAGVLYAAKGAPLRPVVEGGGQERHRRGGTENVLAIAALGFMCSLAPSEISAKAKRVTELRDHFEARVLREIADVSVTAGASPRVGNTSSLLIPGTDGETLLMSLDMEGFAVSTGAACSSGSPEPSPVLLAMGLSRDEAQCSLRVGVGWSNTQGDIDRFVDVLKKVVARLRTLRSYQVSKPVSEATFVAGVQL